MITNPMFLRIPKRWLCFLPSIFYGNPSMHQGPTWDDLGLRNRGMKCPWCTVTMLPCTMWNGYETQRFIIKDCYFGISCAGLQHAPCSIWVVYVCAYANTSVLLDDSWSLCLILECRSCWQCMLRSQRHRNAVSTMFCGCACTALYRPRNAQCGLAFCFGDRELGTCHPHNWDDVMVIRDGWRLGLTPFLAVPSSLVSACFGIFGLLLFSHRGSECSQCSVP